MHAVFRQSFKRALRVIIMPAPYKNTDDRQNYCIKIRVIQVAKFLKVRREALKCRCEIVVAFAKTILCVAEFAIPILAAAAQQTG